MVDSLLSKANGNWERSSESGEIDITGAGSKLTTSTRTSSTFWCNNECLRTEVSSNIASKIQEIIHIPTYHFEPIQILKYNVGERFVAHHDYSYQELTLPCGPRVITFFMYLCDVEEGGETFSPVLNITITPKKGRAVVWANTLSRDPSKKDSRMTH
jgi:prolyl 4-hydroxylase